MKKFSLKFLPYFFWLIIFVLIPMAIILGYSLVNPENKLTLENIVKIANYKKTLLKSLAFSLITTTLCLAIAYPFSYFVSQIKNSMKQKIVVALITLPMWTNLLLRTFAWMTLIENNGIINKLLKFFGLAPIKIMNGPIAVIIVMVYDFLPFMILPIYGAIEKINKNLIEAGSDLGANSFQVFKFIILPLSASGIFSGICIVFISSASTFIIPRLFGGGSITLIGDLIESQFLGSVYNPWFGSALALALTATMAAVMALTNKFKKNNMEFF